MNAIDAAVCFETDGSISVSASPDTLSVLGMALAEGPETTIDLIPTSTPRDCEQAASIRVRWESDPGVSVVREGNEVVLVGDPAAVAQLANNIARLGSDPAKLGGHIHLEHFPDHAYLRPGSTPVVVIVM